tara:strand:- start:5599 stop:6360 length:762 start_codon:yes stop_codon:yes gene_type:complete
MEVPTMNYWITLSTLAIFLLSTPAYTSVISFDDRALFEGSIRTMIVDDYQDAAYRHGDINDFPTNDRFSDQRMSEIFSETSYTTPNGENNATATYVGYSDDRYYCGGCNGSFELGFMDTSISNSLGVSAVGLDIGGNYGFHPYTAFVTFGDDSKANFSLPLEENAHITLAFWGIASDLGIKSIHFGDFDGLPTHEGSFSIDNLTIGNFCSGFPGGGATEGCFPNSRPFPVPEPSALVLLALGLLGLGTKRLIR